MEDVEGMIADVGDSKSANHFRAVERLGSMKDRRIEPAMIKLLDSEDWLVKRHAVAVLGNLKSRKAVAPLIRLVEQEGANMEWAASEALGKIGDRRAVPALLELFRKNGERRYLDQGLNEVIAKLGVSREQFGEIVGLLENGTEEQKELSAHLLGCLKDKRAVKPLIRALGSGNERVKSFAAHALGRIGDRRANPHLISILESPGPALGYPMKEAAESLGKLGVDARELGAIADLAREGRMPGVVALGEIKGAKAVPLLIEALGNEALKTEAMRALKKIGKPAVPKLVKALGAQEPKMRRRAAEILGNIRDQKAAPALADALNDRDAVVRRKAAEALGKVCDSKEARGLVKARNDADPSVRRKAAEALERMRGKTAVQRLMKALGDEKAPVREKAAEALGRLRERGAVPQLIKALDDPCVDVAYAAARSLGWIRDSRAIPPLLKIIETGSFDVRAINPCGYRFGCPASRALRAIGLGMLSQEKRVMCMLSLGKIYDAAKSGDAATLLGLLERYHSSLHRRVFDALLEMAKGCKTVEEVLDLEKKAGESCDRFMGLTLAHDASSIEYQMRFMGIKVALAEKKDELVRGSPGFMGLDGSVVPVLIEAFVAGESSAEWEKSNLLPEPVRLCSSSVRWEAAGLLEEVIKLCPGAGQLEKLEAGLEEGFSRLLESAKDGNSRHVAEMPVARVRETLAERKKALAYELELPSGDKPVLPAPNGAANGRKNGAPKEPLSKNRL